MTHNERYSVVGMRGRVAGGSEAMKTEDDEDRKCPQCNEEGRLREDTGGGVEMYWDCGHVLPRRVVSAWFYSMFKGIMGVNERGGNKP